MSFTVYTSKYVINVSPDVLISEHRTEHPIMYNLLKYIIHNLTVKKALVVFYLELNNGIGIRVAYLH